MSEYLELWRMWADQDSVGSKELLNISLTWWGRGAKFAGLFAVALLMLEIVGTVRLSETANRIRGVASPRVVVALLRAYFRWLRAFMLMYFRPKSRIGSAEYQRHEAVLSEYIWFRIAGGAFTGWVVYFAVISNFERWWEQLLIGLIASMLTYLIVWPPLLAILMIVISIVGLSMIGFLRLLARILIHKSLLTTMRMIYVALLIFAIHFEVLLS